MFVGRTLFMHYYNRVYITIITSTFRCIIDPVIIFCLISHENLWSWHWHWTITFDLSTKTSFYIFVDLLYKDFLVALQVQGCKVWQWIFSLFYSFFVFSCMIAHRSGTEMIICAQFSRIPTKVTTTISTIFVENGTEEETTRVDSKHPAQAEVAKMELLLMTESWSSGRKCQVSWYLSLTPFIWH